MNLIALETATDVCGVALAQGGQVTVELALARPRAHAENLVLLIEDALRYGGIKKEELDAVAVSMGPGSYTGLRIGVSATKGLSAALDLKLVGVPTLEAIAISVASAAAEGDVICAALNARRDEVYASAFQVNAGGTMDATRETAALTAAELPGWLSPALPGTLWLAGDGAPKVAEALGADWRGPVRLLDPALHRPSAAEVARQGLQRLERGELAEASTFEPFYLKEFVAKRREHSAFERMPFQESTTR